MQPTQSPQRLDAGLRGRMREFVFGTLRQRGIARPYGPFCDIGAYELVVAAAPPLFANGFE